MKLYICSTYYHVYVALLKQLAEHSETDLVVCDDIPTGEQLACRIRESGLFHRVWFVAQSKLPEVRGKNRLDWVLFQHRRRAKAIRPMLPFSLKDYRDIYIFHDGTALGMYLNDEKWRYHLAEDSLNLYQRILDTEQAHFFLNHGLKYRLRRLLDSGYFPLGDSRYVIDVEVNENRNLQVKLPKVTEVPRHPLEERLTGEEQKLLLKVFDCQDLPKAGAGTALLLTEPLYADREAQKTLYRSIADALTAKGYAVLLKPHPRDGTEYEGLGLRILKREFPIELLCYLPGVEFGCVAAVSSAGVHTAPARKKFFWKNGALVEVKAEKNT